MRETQALEYVRGPHTISTDPDRIDVRAVHRFLTGSYWAKGVPIDVVTRAIRGSLCFGIYRGARQVGFARVITDGATFAYLADVFVVPAARGRGLASWLLECVLGHPVLQGLRRFLLATRDAHRLYARCGFRPLGAPDRFMEIAWPDVYRRRGVSRLPRAAKRSGRGGTRASRR